MCKNLLDFLRILLAYSFRGIHDTLVPITPYLAELFESLRVDGVRPPRIRASDMRHVLLVLPFLLHDLLKDEVAAFKFQHPVSGASHCGSISGIDRNHTDVAFMVSPAPSEVSTER